MSDGAKVYPVGIVGESNYQEVIARCAVGEAVEIVWEPDNPYDSEALVVLRRGHRIGYIGRDNWLQSVVHEEGRKCSATILEVRSNGPHLAIVMEVSICAGPIRQQSYYLDPPRRTWFERLLNL